MGYTRFFEGSAAMSLSEAQKGIQVVHDFAVSQAKFLSIRDEAPTGIVVDTRPERCLGVGGSICFMPEQTEEGYVLQPEWCKTYGRQPIDALIKQLLEQLREAVNGKVELAADGPWDSNPWT